MARRAAALLAVSLAWAGAAAAAPGEGADSTAILYASSITQLNKLALAVSNYGFLGNNFGTRSPSFEYPVGSGYEHMSRAGLWVGGYALSDTGAVLGVTTALVDDVQGANSVGQTEFTPLGDGLRRSSRIANSRYWRPDAVSDDDLVCFYADEPAKPASGLNRERHTPLRIRVRQTSHAFGLPAAESFVVMRYTIVNAGPPLRGAWVGLYAQLVSGDKDAYSTWPPSAGSGPGSWYYRALVGFDSTRSLYTEHFCQSKVNVPASCNFSYCPPWAGVKFLRALPAGPRDVTLHWWTFARGDTALDTDAERYARLSEPVKQDPGACPIDGSCSPIMLMGVGPFPEIAPGDSIEVDFAFLGGEDRAALDRHADYAQFAAGIDYRLPSPPPSPRLLVESGEQRLDLWWDDSPEFAVDPASQIPGGIDFEGYRVYAGLDRDAPNLVGQYDLVDTTGYNTGLDSVRLAEPRVVDGVTYRYHRAVRNLKDGFRYWGAVTSYDTGDESTGSLESGLAQNRFVGVPNPAAGESPVGIAVYPNPYRVDALWDAGENAREHYVWFTGLPSRCVLRLYTLSGDRILQKRLEGPSAERAARGVWLPSRDRDTGAPAISGTSFAWDLLTERGQAAASGLYLWSVEDLDGGAFTRGKLLVVKSNRP